MMTNDNISKFECTGTIGDTIGGLSAPIIGIISSVIIIVTLKEQINSNIKQQKSFKADKFYDVSIDYLKEIKHQFQNFEYGFPKDLNETNFYNYEPRIYTGNKAFHILTTLNTIFPNPPIIMDITRNLAFAEISLLIIHLDQFLYSINRHKDQYPDEFILLGENLIAYNAISLGLYFKGLVSEYPDLDFARQYRTHITELETLKIEIKKYKKRRI